MFIADTVSGETRPFLNESSDDSMPSWTARGDYVLFVSDRTGTSGLWGVPMLGGSAAGPAQLLQQDLGRVIKLLGVTSRDEYHYLRQVGLVDVYTVAIGADGGPAGTPRGVAQSFVGSNMMPTFSPDGRAVAFLAQMGFSARERLGIRDLSLGTQRTVATNMTFLRAPQWSPDGTRMLVKGNDASGEYGFHLVDLATGATRTVVAVPPDRENSLGIGRWAPDGGSFVFVERVDDRVHFRRLVLDTGATVPLFALDEGTWIAGVPGFDILPLTGAMAMVVTQAGASTLVVRGPDGHTREVGRFSGVDRPLGVAWSPDGTALYFTRQAESLRAVGVWRQPLDGRPAEALGIEMPGLRNLAVSPDGQQLAFTAGAPLREPWVLEHFLPPPSRSAARRAGR